MGKRGMRSSHGAGTASGVDLPMLKVPLVEQTWRERAACKGEPIDLFYQPRGDSENYEEAAEICQGCPVRKECLLFAIEYNENWGFWGGLSLSKRRWVHTLMGDAANRGVPFDLSFDQDGVCVVKVDGKKHTISALGRRLTEEEINEARKFHYVYGATKRLVASHFRLSPRTVDRILEKPFEERTSTDDN